MNEKTDLSNFLDLLIRTRNYALDEYYQKAIEGSKEHQKILVECYLYGLLGQEQSIDMVKHYASLGWEDALKALETIEKEDMPKDITKDEKFKRESELFKILMASEIGENK